MEGNSAKLIRNRSSGGAPVAVPFPRPLPLALALAVALALVLTLVLTVAACSNDGGDDDDESRSDGRQSAPTTAPADPDPDQFCHQLRTIIDDDPFGSIFGNDDPMDAAAAFDRGQESLDALVALAPDDIEAAATTYRDAFAGYRDIILPDTTIDASTYQDAFDDLRAEQDAARAQLDDHLERDC